MKTSKYALLLLPVLLVASCTARYAPDMYSVKQAPVVTKNAHPSLTQVGQAIDVAGRSLGWKMQDVRPGYTIATLDVRDHEAKVGITYSVQNYSIAYISSKNLMRDGYMHKNYNGWVKNLNTAIANELLAVK